MAAETFVPSFFPLWFIAVLLILTIIKLILKGFALWYSAGKQQKAWFVCILIFNTIGILPLVYLLVYQPWKLSVSGT